MGKRLFVGGLPYSATSDQLKDLFSQVGTVVSANVIMDKYSGQSKGFGFVEMTTEEEAQKAVDTLNGTELDGRKIAINEARPLEARPQGSFGGGGRDDRRGGRGDRRGGGRSSRW